MKEERVLATLVLLLAVAVSCGCASESRPRAAFRMTKLGSPARCDRLRTFKSGYGRELLWTTLRDGVVASKLWARADFAGVGTRMSREAEYGSDIPFAAIEQFPWLVTYRFELYTLRQFESIDRWKREPTSILPSLFPHADPLLTDEALAELRAETVGDDTIVFGGEGEADRLWLRLRVEDDNIHVRGYLCTLWPATMPAEENAHKDRGPLLADLAMWSWYQAQSPVDRDREKLFKRFELFRLYMQFAADMGDILRTDAEQGGREGEDYTPGEWYWLYQLWMSALLNP